MEASRSVSVDRGRVSGGPNYECTSPKGCFFYTFLPGRHFTKGHLAKRASDQKGHLTKRTSDQKGPLAKGENKSPDVAPV